MALRTDYTNATVATDAHPLAHNDVNALVNTLERRAVNNQTGTTYAPVLADENRMVTLSNAAAITVTLPAAGTAAFPVGAEIEFLWLGVGKPTFTNGAGATLNAAVGKSISARYAKVAAKLIAASTWVLTGSTAV